MLWTTDEEELSGGWRNVNDGGWPCQVATARREELEASLVATVAFENILQDSMSADLRSSVLDTLFESEYGPGGKDEGFTAAEMAQNSALPVWKAGAECMVMQSESVSWTRQNGERSCYGRWWVRLWTEWHVLSQEWSMKEAKKELTPERFRRWKRQRKAASRRA